MTMNILTAVMIAAVMETATAQTTVPVDNTAIVIEESKDYYQQLSDELEGVLEYLASEDHSAELTSYEYNAEDKTVTIVVHDLTDDYVTSDGVVHKIYYAETYDIVNAHSLVFGEIGF